MTTKTDITLPPLPEWSKMDDLGGLVPSEVRVALAGYARAAVEADRQGRMPSDDERGTSDPIAGLPRAQSVSDEMMDLVDRLGSEYDEVDPRAWEHLLVYAPKLSRYGSSQPAATTCGGTDDDRPAANEKPICYASVNKHGDVTRTTNRADKWSKVPLYTRSVQQPAVSAEPVGPVRLRDEGSEIYLDGVQCRYSIEQGEPWPYSDTLAYAFDPGIAERIVAALNAAPVAQEPPQVTDAEIEQIVTGAGARWDGSVWKVEDADLHPMARALLYRYTTAPVAAQLHVTDEMVTRFLGWHLPQDFAPDAGIAFNPSPDPHSWPVGTNLFTDPQARAMLEYVLRGAPAAAQAHPSAQDREDAQRWKWLKTEAKGHDFDNLSIRLPEQMDVYADAARAAKEKS